MATRKPPTTPSKGVQRNARSGVLSPSVKSPIPEVYDLDDFMASARDKHVIGALNRNDVVKYNEAVANLENIIKEKDQKKFDDAEEAVRRLLKTRSMDRNITTLLTELNKLAANVKKAKMRGGDWFQGIKFKDDSSETPVAVAGDVPTDNKSAPKSEQTDVSWKLLAIEKILEDALADEIGATTKTSGNRTTDDVLKSIEILCTSAVKYRARAAITFVEKEAMAKRRLLIAKEWITTFEMHMKEPSPRKEEFKHSLPLQCSELDAIRNTLNRLMKKTKEREDDRKSLEEENTKLAKDLLSLLTDKYIKTGNSKKAAPDEENDIKQLLKSSISELNSQIDDLRNQETRLQNVTTASVAYNAKLVAAKKTTPSKRSQEQQSKLLSAIFETELKKLEDECDRNNMIVKQLDDEIECLKKDIEDLDKSENVKEFKDVDKCSLTALRSARINLQRHKREKVQKGSADEIKELQIALNAMEKDVLELSDEHVDSLASSAQQTQSVLNKAQIIQKQLKKAIERHSRLKQRLRENNDSMQRFSKQIVPHLDLVINTLTNKPQDGHTSQEICPECPQILMPIFVRVLRIKCISEQALGSLHLTFEVIVGRELQNSVGPNTNGDNQSRENIIGTVEMLVKAATSNGITGENTSKLKAKVQKMDAYQQEAMKLRGEITYWEATAKREENEKQEYMNRVSKVASAKPMDSNPNIADLSDPNRQTQLAEEYSQLYDNEWTNAYEDREVKQPTESEENRIKHLLEILTTVYSTCADLRTQQLTGMKTAILQPATFFCILNERPTTEATGIENKKIEGDKETNKRKTTNPPKYGQPKSPPDATKYESEDVTLGILQSQAITDLGKQTSTQALPDITKYFQSSNESWFNSKNLRKYTTKCIEICWLMNIHSPPVCLDDDIPTGSQFDKAKYREYTARGKKVKFVVWPAVLLHENGPTLGKGVAQGMG